MTLLDQPILETPPSGRRGRGPSADYSRLVAMVKEAGGQWLRIAIFADGDNKSAKGSAAALASNINTGKLKAFAARDIEACSGRLETGDLVGRLDRGVLDGGFGVWARYKGSSDII